MIKVKSELTTKVKADDIVFIATINKVGKDYLTLFTEVTNKVKSVTEELEREGFKVTINVPYIRNHYKIVEKTEKSAFSSSKKETERVADGYESGATVYATRSIDQIFDFYKVWSIAEGFSISYHFKVSESLEETTKRGLRQELLNSAERLAMELTKDEALHMVDAFYHCEETPTSISRNADFAMKCSERSLADSNDEVTLERMKAILKFMLREEFLPEFTFSDEITAKFEH